MKEEWEVVMQRLEEVGRLVVRVGKWCQERNMSQKDLPPEFCDVLGTLQKYAITLHTLFQLLTDSKGLGWHSRRTKRVHGGERCQEGPQTRGSTEKGQEI